MTCNPLSAFGVYPDGFTGALLAGESILDGAVILHGPTGCRAHHSSLSEQTFPRDDVAERLNFQEPFYFGQPRIPTSYLDGDDFVFGAREKLVRAVREVTKRNPSLITIVNSPGASLIGDHLVQAAGVATTIPCAVVEMPSLSCSLAEGYQQGLTAVLQALAPAPRPREARTVALLGLSITHQHWAGSVVELRRLLALCGIDVVCAVGAGGGVDEYRELPRAACYAVVHDEYADLIGPWLRERYGGALAAGGLGAPVGFSATIAWVEAVAREAGADPSPAVADIVSQRRRVSRFLGQATGSSALLKGMTFSIQADPSLALPLACWLYEYLGMFPVSVETPPGRETAFRQPLQEWLSAIGCPEAWQLPWHNADPDLLFADGQQVALTKATERRGGVEIMLPSRACLDIVPKAMLGATGGAWLVEQILRELWWVLWL